MSSIIQPNYYTQTYSVPAKARETRQAKAQENSFLVMAAWAGRRAADVQEISRTPEAAETAETSNTDAYMEHLKKKYGRVTIESVGKDQASLEKAGRRMSGNDVVIAPNIFEEMAGDAKKALYYEQKIDYFFNTIIPQGNAICATRGLVFEPCGIVVHEDGTVTYICGCSDSPERVAEVNRINAEKARKKAEQQRQYQEQAAAAAAEHRAMWAHTAQVDSLDEYSPDVGILLRTRMAAAPAVTPDVFLSAGTNLFFLNL